MSDTEAAANFCGACGTATEGSKFCRNCGTPSGVHQAITPAMAASALTGQIGDEEPDVVTNGAPLAPPTPSPSEPLPATETLHVDSPPRPAAPGPPSPARRGPSRPLLFGLAALVVVGIVAAVLVLSSRTSSTTDTADVDYRQKVADAFGPVLGANRQVSDTLAALRETNPADAKIAVARARTATTTATGALGALTAPPASEKLSADAKQVLVRQAAYLSAVSGVLSYPSVAGASQIQTLASNLTSALDLAGPAVAGKTPTVDGAERLTSWARSTSLTLRRQAQAQAKKTAAKKAKAKAKTGASTGGGSAVTSNPYSNGRSCGSGLYAGPNTSCEFAANVRRAYNDAPGLTASVRAYSPATATTFTMDCRPSGNGITCSGGNNASVTF
jgi:hypothetical protein